MGRGPILLALVTGLFLGACGTDEDAVENLSGRWEGRAGDWFLAMNLVQYAIDSLGGSVSFGSPPVAYTIREGHRIRPDSVYIDLECGLFCGRRMVGRLTDRNLLEGTYEISVFNGFDTTMVWEAARRKDSPSLSKQLP